MKHAVLTALLLGAVAFESPAQQSGKAVAVAPGPAPSVNYVWMTLRGANAVDVRRTDGSFVRTFAPGAPTNFNQPWDIVGIPSLHRVYISNRGAVPGTVTVIDSDTLQFVQIVSFPAGTANLRGMSVSEDGSAIFVAGADAAGSAVYRLDPTTLAPATRIGGNADGRGAEDCVVIRAANSGGTGSGPGKVFFSSRGPLATGYIGIINTLAGNSFSQIFMSAVNPAQVQLPDLMERTPDHRFLFVACSKIIGFGNNSQIIRVDPLSGTATATVLTTGFQDLDTGNRSYDVTWRTDSGGGNRGFVLVQQDAGGRDVVEINDAGAPTQPPVQADANGVTPSSLRFAPLSQQLFAGELFGTSNRYNHFTAPNPPPVVYTNFQLSSGGDPFNFAVMSTPAVVISDITPRAGPATVGTLATVHGAGFQSGLGALAGGTPVPITFIDSNTATVDFSALGVGTFDLQINNPNVQSGSFGTFYRSYAPPPIVPLPTDPVAQLPLPSAAQGYRMVSYPQYATLTALKSAFAAQLGPYNPVLYRVFFYRQGAYVELNQLADDGSDLAGESFWVLTRNGAILTLTEPDVAQNDAGSDRVIPISPGFNLISLPILNAAGISGSIPWAGMHVTDDETNFTVGSPGGPPSVTSAQGLLLVEQAVEFVNGGYFLAPNLIAGQGYWVRNLTTGPVYLVFQPGLVTKAGTGSSAPGVPPAAGSMPPSPPSGMGGEGSGSGGCGLLGGELLLLLALLRTVGRGRLGA